MAPDLLRVVWACSLQVALIVLVGALLAVPLRLRDDPRARLVLWRLVLACTMVAPLSAIVRPQATAAGAGAAFGEAMLVTTEWGGAASSSVQGSQVPALLVALLALGACYRLGRLVASLVVLRRLARGQEVVVNALGELQHRIGARAKLVTASVAQPFTFGGREAVIVVPAAFEREPDIVQRAVLAHELVHVRRRDWLQATLEDVCGIVFWFHPAVWLAIAELRLAREEIVDREASHVLGSRRAYLTTLLAFASRGRAHASRAPAFFRHRQLARRIAALSREVSMSRRLLVSTGIASALLLTLAVRTAQAAFPVPGLPQAAPATPSAGSDASVLEQLAHRVPSDAPPPRKVHDVRPAYPESVRQVVTSAVFGVRVVVDVDGSIAEARIVTQRIAGPGATPEALAAAVARLTENTLTAVRRWRFEPPAKAPLAMTITVAYDDGVPRAAPPPPPPPPAPGEGSITPPVAVYQPHPVYPEDARQAGMRGVVVLAVTIGVDGTVSNPRVIQSIPALDAAALDAARHWTFRPGTRNGAPVEVETEITFAFELRD